MTEQWIHFLHELATTIGAIAAVLAAASSLRNGRSLKRNGIPPPDSPPKKEMPDEGFRKRPKDDWYQPPTLF